MSKHHSTQDPRDRTDRRASKRSRDADRKQARNAKYAMQGRKGS